MNAALLHLKSNSYKFFSMHTLIGSNKALGKHLAKNLYEIPMSGIDRKHR